MEEQDVLSSMSEKLVTPLEFWTYSTMLIDNQWGGHGTGFLVAISSKDDNTQVRVILVTNKHVINPDHVHRKSADKIRLHFNIRDKEDELYCWSEPYFRVFIL